MTISRCGSRSLWLVSLVLGCTLGSKSVGEEGGSSSASGTGDASGEDSTAGSLDSSASEVSTAEVSTAEDSSAGSDESGAAMCEQYISTFDIGPGVDVSVRSEASAAVFFDTSGCNNWPVLTITAPGGEDVQHRLGECSLETCDDFIGQAECSAGCNDCGPPNGGRLEAAAVGESGWPGWWLTELEVDPMCAPADGECPSTCKRRDQAPAGTYEIALTVYRSCTGACVCDDVFPMCGLFGENELSDAVTFTTTVDYPAQTTAEIVITDP